VDDPRVHAFACAAVERAVMAGVALALAVHLVRLMPLTESGSGTHFVVLMLRVLPVGLASSG